MVHNTTQSARKHITLENGLRVITFPKPPPDFEPLTASAHDLQTYGFPPIPADPHHRQRYERVFGLLKNKLNIIEPTFRVNADRKHGPRQGGGGGNGKQRAANSAGTETSTNWSGGVVYAPAGDNFRWIQGDWVVPNVDAPTQNEWYYAASWIGIDGDGSGDVFQAGVECDVFNSGGSITRNVYPWWEWFPNSEVQITNLAVSPGDMITMLICSTGQGATTGTVYFTNRTSGDSMSVGLTAPAGTSLQGNSAEWVVEAPTVNGGQSALADYGEVFFSSCEAVTTANATIDGGTGDNINMTAGGNTVSDGILLTSTVIECSYAGPLP